MDEILKFFVQTSQTWFPESERMLTTGLLGVAPTISQVIFIIVSNTKTQRHKYNNKILVYSNHAVALIF